MKKKSIDHTQLLLLKLLAGEDMYGYHSGAGAPLQQCVRNEGGDALPRAARHGA